MSERGEGYEGVFKDVLAVVSATIMITKSVWDGEVDCGSNIAGGLHHASQKGGADFVFSTI